MKAIAILFDKNFVPSGSVIFEEHASGRKTLVTVTVPGNNILSKGLHGFHIHSSGDLSEHCDSLCAHYNPTNDVHGGPTSFNRHLGDLGNVRASHSG